MLALHRQVDDDRLCGAGGLQLAFSELVSFDGTRRRKIKISVPKRDARRPLCAEVLFQIGAAVAVRVAQADDAALLAAVVLERHEHIAVGCDGEMPRGPEAVGDHDRAKSRRQRDAAIVGIARRRSGASGRNRGGKQCESTSGKQAIEQLRHSLMF